MSFAKLTPHLTGVSGLCQQLMKVLYLYLYLLEALLELSICSSSLFVVIAAAASMFKSPLDVNLKLSPPGKN